MNRRDVLSAVAQHVHRLPGVLELSWRLPYEQIHGGTVLVTNVGLAFSGKKILKNKEYLDFPSDNLGHVALLFRYDIHLLLV